MHSQSQALACVHDDALEARPCTWLQHAAEPGPKAGCGFIFMLARAV